MNVSILRFCLLLLLAIPAGTAILVAVMSPPYMNSQWCRRELKKFLETTRAQGRPRIGNKARVVKVIKNPIDRQDHPPELQNVLGYEGDSMTFQLLNLVGAIFLIVNTAYYGAYPSAFVNVVWIGIALVTIIHIKKKALDR